MTSDPDHAQGRAGRAPRGRASALRNSAAFARAFSDGRRVHDPAFSLHFRANSLTHARAGIGVARRVARKATERNRIKRVLREAFRVVLDELPPVDIVIIARPPAAGMNNQALRSAFLAALRRLPAQPFRT